MSRLKRRAIINLEVSSLCWDKRFENDVYADQACIELHDAVVCALKYLLKINNIKCDDECNIKVLLSNLPSVYFSYRWYSFIEGDADTLIEWDATLHDNKEYHDVSDTYLTVREHVKLLLDSL